jgi:hypothetical protein
MIDQEAESSSGEMQPTKKRATDILKEQRDKNVRTVISLKLQFFIFVMFFVFSLFTPNFDCRKRRWQTAVKPLMNDMEPSCPPTGWRIHRVRQHPSQLPTPQQERKEITLQYSTGQLRRVPSMLASVPTPRQGLAVKVDV